MILVDTNLILYAEDSTSPFHTPAREWWDSQLSGAGPVGLCWPVLNAFLRITTNPRILRQPLTRDQACARVQSWLDQPCTRLLTATDRHWELLRRLLTEADATANLVPDAHLAALAVGHGATLFSSDRDFARFRSLDWRNPLAR